MAQQASFSSILDAPATDSVRPPALPGGNYVAMIKGLPTRGTSSKKGTPFIDYTFVFLAPYVNAEGESDVDPEALTEFGQIQGKEMHRSFWFPLEGQEDKSSYIHREFLENDLRIDLDGKSHWEGAQETPGKQVIVFVRQKPRDDGKGVYSEIAGTAPVED